MKSKANLQIRDMLHDLAAQNEAGELAFLAFVSVKRDGDSQRMITGDASPFIVISSLEIIKAAVLKAEMDRAEFYEEIPTRIPS